jgi:creatinine amidohydrolase
VGTLEAHGRHAPIGTDNFCAEEIAWRLAERLGWPVAPTLNYGITTGLVSYPGGVRIEKDLYADLAATILQNFFAMGFRRVVIINGHGGNTETLSGVMKELITHDRGNRHLILIDWWHLGEEALAEVYGRPGGHAALDETACMVAFRPETLDAEAFSPEDQSTMRPGVMVAPYSSAVLLYGEGDAAPDFDRRKAQAFTEKVLDRIEAVLKSEVEKFERSFGKPEVK